MKTLLKTMMDVAGGREGRAVARDGKLDVTLAFPKALGGNGAGTNPEQLFAAGFAACFNTSLRVSTKLLGPYAADMTVTVTVGLTVADDGAHGTTAYLMANTQGVACHDRERLLAKAKRVSAFSNLMKGLGVMSDT